jgi:hypothetical protein
MYFSYQEKKLYISAGDLPAGDSPAPK